MQKKTIGIVLVVIIIIGAIIIFSSSGTPAPTTDAQTQTSGETATTTPSKTYTLAEVATHKTQSDCWTTVSGKVYDLTSFVSAHPGGEENILRICGIDGTAAFTDQHGGQRRPEKELAKLFIGTLTK